MGFAPGELAGKVAESNMPCALPAYLGRGPGRFSADEWALVGPHLSYKLG